MRNSLDPTPIIDLAVGFWGAKTLLSAAEIGLFTILAPSPLDRETLATRLQLHPPGSFSFPAPSRSEPTPVTAGPLSDGPPPQCSHSLRT